MKDKIKTNILATRISSLVLLTIIFTFSISIFINGVSNHYQIPKLTLNSFFDKSFITNMEEFIGNNIPQKHTLKQFSSNLKLITGNIQQDGIYVSKNMLIEKSVNHDKGHIQNNINTIKQIGMKSNIPVFLMLIPSKGAIKQTMLPDYIPDGYDDRNYIEEIYSKLAGHVSSVDAYSVLFDRRDDYIYYKTDANLTSLGGYYAYTILAERIGKTPLSIDDFSRQFINSNYYGPTYYQAPCLGIEPDIVTLYHYKSDEERKSIVIDNLSNVRYNSIYPTMFSTNPTPNQIILDGNNSDISISNSGKPNRNVLILGDDSALPILPFLSAQISELRFVNTTIAQPVIDTHIEEFGQIVLIYDLKTFTNSDIYVNLKFDNLK